MADGYFDFTAGAVLTAGQVEDYLMKQAILKYATAAARDADATLTAALREGMHVYLADSNTLVYYDGAAWVAAAAGTSHKLVRKSADETVTSSTTLQNDDELLFAVAANEVWVGLLFVYYTTLTTADIKFAITGPAGSSGRLTVLAPSISVGSGSYNDYQGNSAGLGGTLTRGGSGTGGDADTAILAVTIENGATAGNGQLQWAQAVSNATAATVYEHSFLVAHKVA